MAWGGPPCAAPCPVAWGRAFPAGIIPISGIPKSLLGGDRGAGHVTPPPPPRDPPPGFPLALGRGLGGRFECWTPFCPQEPITSGPGCQPCIPPSSSLRPDNVPIFLPAVASRCTKPPLSAGSGRTKGARWHQMQEHNINLFVPETAAGGWGGQGQQGQKGDEDSCGGLVLSASQFAPVKPWHKAVQCLLGVMGGEGCNCSEQVFFGGGSVRLAPMSPREGQWSGWHRDKGQQLSPPPMADTHL